MDKGQESEERADLLQVSLCDNQRALSGRMRHLSFDAPVAGDDSDITMLDTLHSDNETNPDLKIMSESLSKEITANLNMLAPRARMVLPSYFRLDR